MLAPVNTALAIQAKPASTGLGAGIARPLAALMAELGDLCRRVALLPADAAEMLQMSVVGRASHAWRQTLHEIDVHLYLTASQLMPVWRDMCADARKVDRMEVRLYQLRALTRQILDAGADDVMAEARCAVLAEELQQHRARVTVLLRALDAVADHEALHALSDVWLSEAARLNCAQRQGQTVVMDNEDADPVGRPPV